MLVKMKSSLLEKFQQKAVSISLSTLSLFALSCHEQPQKASPSAMMQQKDSSAKKYTAAMVDNKTDPNCGMPVTAGIIDTVHYEGKVYGFCSDECKQAFLKNPAALAKNTQLK